MRELCTPYNAGRLLYCALSQAEREPGAGEYRELISEYISNVQFRSMVEDFARGMELTVLAVTLKGLVLAPSGADSRFAVRISDLRVGLDMKQKVGLLLAQIVIAATFFPTTDSLENDDFVPPPAALIDFRSNLEVFLHKVKEASAIVGDEDGTIAEGWQYLMTLPSSNPSSERASLASLSGFLKLSINHLERGGMLVVERKSLADERTLYTPTFRMKVHLREFALQQIYELAGSGAAGVPRHSADGLSIAELSDGGAAFVPEESPDSPGAILFRAPDADPNQTAVDPATVDGGVRGEAVQLSLNLLDSRVREGRGDSDV
ncbi:MAG: hypothetical protein IPM93_00175 [Candidatus Obscuribacter sp.]|nr:hypothetical protein [Candidatus Obscuribacter sp.]